MTDNMSWEENYQRLKAFIEKQDWRGLAESFHKGDMVWHAQEWENFIKKIQASRDQKIREEVAKMKFYWSKPITEKEHELIELHNETIDKILALLDHKEG